MTPDKLIELVQAIKENKIIQIRYYDNSHTMTSSWQDVKPEGAIEILCRNVSNNLAHKSSDFEFRIKPVPKYFVPKVGEKYWEIGMSYTSGVMPILRLNTEFVVPHDHCFSTREKAQACADELQKVLDKHREIINE